jgi:hypothetical protein
MVHKQIHFGTVVLDVPGKHLRIGRLEHHLRQTDRLDDSIGDVRVPRLHVLGDAFRLDHDQVHAGVEKPAREMDWPGDVAPAFDVERLDGTTGQQHLAGTGSRSGHRSIHSTNDPTLSVTTITRRTRSLLYISFAPARASSTDG